MLLTDCLPGRVVTLHRRSVTFTAKVDRTTDAGCVVLRIFLHGCRSLWPREVWARPADLEPLANGQEAVEQTAAGPGALVPARVQVERGCKSQVSGTTA